MSAPGSQASSRADAQSSPAPAAPVVLDRIRVRRDFLRVAATQRKWVTPGVIVQACPCVAPPSPGVESVSCPESGGGVRVGFTCSRKVGNAVARNRARRRLRAAAAQVLPLAAEPGWDYVLIGRPATVDRPFEDLLHDLRMAVKRVRTATPGAAPPRKGGGPARGRTRGARGAKQSGMEAGGMEAGTP